MERRPASTLAVLAVIGFALVSLAPVHGGSRSNSIVISSPLDGAVFPRDFAAPVFRWIDPSPRGRWRLRIELEEGSEPIERDCDRPEWRPNEKEWESIKARSVDRAARLSVTEVPSRNPGGSLASPATVSFWTSRDPVGAPIFYREVPLPVGFAMDNKPLIRWKLGDVSSGEPPRVLLEGMKTCANCHSFSSGGRTLAMDIDFASDKGTYAIADVGPTVRIGRSQMMSWNDLMPEDGESTYGLLSSISPDGRHVVSTVKETILLSFMPDPFCSQLFFPIRGILVAYDRTARVLRPVGGADDPGFVQTNAVFSPDGKWLVFARAKVPDIPRKGTVIDPEVLQQVVPELLDGRRRICFDLYRVPFNGGRGGTAEPIPGASGNGLSNFFARYSPDGRWIVFCQASSMMLNRPDSALFILPAKGGVPRRLRCNALGRMNSWHSFSPNGRWLVYASKADGPMTQLWLTHLSGSGEDTPPVMLDGFVEPDRAANLPEFVDVGPDQLRRIEVAEEIRSPVPSLPHRPK